MAEPYQASALLPSRTHWWARSRQVILGVLFGAILLIPRLRRLRRRVWAWSAVRGIATVLGVALVWRFMRGVAETGSLVGGIALVAFAVLVRARPQTKSIDDTRRELGALVALNGGSLVIDDGARQVRNVTIFVTPERLIVRSAVRVGLPEIPIGQLKQVEVLAKPNGGSELRIRWAENTTTRFSYVGAFAEHLARVAAETILTVWKKPLPVVR